MRTITHRELRNNSSAVLRQVAEGESFEITNNGEVVARIVPVRATSDIAIVRPATTHIDFVQDLVRIEIDEKSEDVLADLRGER